MNGGGARAFPRAARRASVCAVLVGRNDPCPCGSGKKYKKCHLGSELPMAREAPTSAPKPAPPPPARREPKPTPAVSDALAREVSAACDELPPDIVDHFAQLLSRADDGDAASPVSAIARALADAAHLDALFGAPTLADRIVLSLLHRAPHRRRELAAALALTGHDEPGEALRASLRRWPVAMRSIPGHPEHDDIFLFAPVRRRLRARLGPPLTVPCAARRAPLPLAGLAADRLALALAVGLLAQRRARRTAGGAMHATDRARLVKTLPAIERLAMVWEHAHAFEVAKGDFTPRLAAVARAVAEEAPLLRLCLTLASEDAETLALGRLAAALPPDVDVDLGMAAVAAYVQHHEALTPTHVVGYLALAADAKSRLLSIDAAAGTFAVPADVRALLRGEPLPLSGRSFVQPNFEVVLGQAAPFAHAVTIGLAAELVACSAVAKLRLTRESVRTALGFGLEAAQLLAALRAVAAPNEVPPIVAHAIEEWAGDVGTATEQAVTLLTLKGSRAVMARATEALRPIVLRALDDGALILSRPPTPKERAALAASGVTIGGATAAEAGGTEGSAIDLDEGLPWEPGATLPIEASSATLARRDLRVCAAPSAIDEAVRVSVAHLSASSPEAKARRGARPPVLPPAPPPAKPKPAAPPAVDHVKLALEGKRAAWKGRPDYAAQLDAMIEGDAFRVARARQPEAVLRALLVAESPQRLMAEVTKIALGG
jgi:hypothetical protein